MYDSRYPPELVLRTAINAPDSLLVIGFLGRDTVYGQDAVILKGDETETDGSRFVLPERAITEVQGGRSLYILDGDTVYAAPADVLETADGNAVEREQFKTYADEEVTVGAP